MLPLEGLANPVSFKDGWGIMPTYSSDWSDFEVNYSFDNKQAFGLSNFYRDGTDSTADFGIARYNRLLSRWNELDSQANIYASAGVGGRHDSEHDDSLAAYLNLQADYETRRIYTVIEGETLQSADSVQFNRVRARAGVAPYLAPFEQLQTWMILQIDYMPEMKDETEVTPLLRFFYNNYALEAGVSFNGAPFLAAMAHF